MSLRGIDLLAAATPIAEFGDLRRFDHPKRLMSFLGLVPSECSTGASRFLGNITKTGNAHARRMLIEAACAYRFPPRIAREIQVRQEGQPHLVREIAWRASYGISHDKSPRWLESIQSTLIHTEALLHPITPTLDRKRDAWTR